MKCVSKLQYLRQNIGRLLIYLQTAGIPRCECNPDDVVASPLSGKMRQANSVTLNALSYCILNAYFFSLE